jgi:CDP-4-dehydro-6-deoxyglucose reductase
VTAPESFDVRLDRARMISPSVRELVFARTDGRPVDFMPGQWVNLMLPHEGGELKRAYSIASAPRGDSSFEIAVTRVIGGPGSERLHAMPAGAEVRAVGPSGLFTREAADPSPALFVGTGTGVTPLRSMMAAALAASSGAPLWLLFGVRHEEEILYREELERWQAERPNVRVFVTLSRPGPGWTGRTGYVQTHLPALWAELGRADAHVYICGLERMVKAVRDLCRKELGIDRKHVHQERYD